MSKQVFLGELVLNEKRNQNLHRIFIILLSELCKFHIFSSNKMKAAVCLLLGFVAVTMAFPQKEGGAYTNEAIRQAQNTQLIPKDAQIQKVCTI